ncbi:hypothetical protein EV368DRAFT_88794 [Lentinula lateritia]|nr:hypothetical protein EV368DRAFT_88794 [Lentinula lateritia]
MTLFSDQEITKIASKMTLFRVGFCRRFWGPVGGAYTEKETAEGYEAFYNVGKLRSAAETRDAIFEQICLASHGVASHVEAVKTADKTAQYWIEHYTQPYNPLLDVNFTDFYVDLDASQDTPVENLHTYLLGHEKYAWHSMHTSWNDATQALFTVRLQGTDITGLTVPPIRSAYMMQYRNGLIGKHFKTLMQTAVFHVQDIVSQSQFTLIKALGELGALLWIAEIDDLEQYLEDLEVLIANVLDAWALVDPTKILKKINLHLLKHLPAHIRRFGPSVRFSTEVFECFNAVFRMCSVLSNHQAPSRDIALKNGELGRVKHIISGGFWVQNGRVSRAGESVLALLKSTPIIQRHLGWVPPHQLKPASVRCPGRDKRTTLSGRNTKAFSSCHCPSVISPMSSWTVATHVISQSEDACPVRSWVIVRCKDRHFIARIAEILHSTDTNPHQEDLVTVQEFTLSEARHHYYGMPVLHEPQKEYQVVGAEMIQFIINVQHDCRLAGCGATARLRRYLPRYLTVPRPLIMDRSKWHSELATELRISQEARRAQIKTQAAATRQKNREKNQTGSTARKRHHAEMELERDDPSNEMDVDLDIPDP